MNPPPTQRQGLSRWYGAILAAILLFSFCTKVVRLGYPSEFYFDETYHAFTAQAYLHGNPDAYDPWAKHPEDRAYEWTHPPLAKLVMAGAMKVFGESAFGWRIGSVAFGTWVVALTAAIALELFGSPAVALMSAFLLSIEGLVFAQSRIAMNDIYFMAFALLALLYYVRWKKRREDWLLFVAGGALGLALATKWTTFYVGLILGVDLCREYFGNSSPRRRLPWTKIGIAFVVLPAVVYLCSYLQFFIIYPGYPGTDRWDRFIELQRQMWYYHTGLQADHSYRSSPWQWILNLRPVWMHVSYVGEGRVANIYNLGNSVILLAGLIAVYFTLFKEKVSSWNRWFLLLAYFALWLPWTISPRIMLFYHYAPAVPFLCILLSRFLDRLYSPTSLNRPRWAIGIVIGALAWFILYYPNSTGISVPTSWANAVYLAVPGWR